MQAPSGVCTTLSLLSPRGYSGSDCGYCKAEDSSQRTPNSRASYYARTKSLCPTDYQTLMDRGWRRSGTLLYLPDVSRSCCPHYTIRLPAAEFSPSRDQRQAINRWNRFVLGEKYIKDVQKKYPKTKAEKKHDNNTFDLLGAIHMPEAPNLKPDIEPEHKFEETLEPDTFTEEKYDLFDNYQRHVHHEGDDEITRSGFKRFLCSSPLHRHVTPSGQKLGSYHQCYRLDGRLIAMGVLDILPHAVSGVYFLYHSDFEKSSFGKLSALREAALALEGGYGYYYMGYYIHRCKKMRYKGDYKPQFVLDYHNFEWDLLDDEMMRLMDKRKYASMSRERQRRAKIDDAHAEHGDAGSPQQSVQTDDPNSNDEEEEINYPTVLSAERSGLSLLELGMPGVMSLGELIKTVDLDNMQVYLGHGPIHKMNDILSWYAGSETDNTSIMGVVAEYAAAVGPEIARDIVVNFGQ